MLHGAYGSGVREGVANGTGVGVGSSAAVNVGAAVGTGISGVQDIKKRIRTPHLNKSLLMLISVR
jgi:F0F1-type ATP synthase membrane subunit c/vacuolar-type H+-ATPase subunit K